MQSTKISKVINGNEIEYDIKNDLIYEKGIMKYEGDRAFVSSPVDLCIEITNKCNFKCKNCFTQISGIDLKSEFYKNAIQENIDSIIRICITGGEPFLNPNLKELIKITNKYNIGKVLSTNGSLFKNKVIKYLAEGNWTVAISLHGIEKNHNLYVGANRFSEILRTLEILMLNNINTHIYCVMHYNFSEDDFFEVKQIKEKFRVSVLRLIKVRKYGKFENEESEFSKNAQKYIEKDIFIKSQRSNTKFISVEGKVGLTN